MTTTWPFAGFASFQFRSTERAMAGTDRGWVPNPTVARSRPYGAARDDIVVMALGSDTREMEQQFDTDRYNTFRALINSEGTLTDWARPVPGQRQAFLVNVEPLDQEVQSVCADSHHSHQRIRCRVTYLSL